jgi:hypothetical protein
MDTDFWGQGWPQVAATMCGTGILPVWRRENAARTSNARPSRRSARRVNDRRAAQVRRGVPNHRKRAGYRTQGRCRAVWHGHLARVAACNAARTSNARPSRRSARRVNDRRAAQYGGASRTAESEPDTGRKARWFSAEPPSFRWCLGRLVMATQHYHTAKTLRNFRMSNVKLRPPFPLKLRPPFPLIPSISTDTYTLNACA